MLQPDPIPMPHTMIKPDFITFTGVDGKTDPLALVELSDDYPLEWGVLFSPKRQGAEPRYPRLETVGWMVSELPVRWSAHLCGGDARQSRHHRFLDRNRRRRV